MVTTTVDRLTEVEAIFRDLEFRRLDALYREDERAFRELFSNEAYLEQSLAAMGQLNFVAEPAADSLMIHVIDLQKDSPDCLVARVSLDATAALGPGARDELTQVLTPAATGRWAYSYGGEGWYCDGAHPLG